MKRWLIITLSVAVGALAAVAFNAATARAATVAPKPAVAYMAPGWHAPKVKPAALIVDGGKDQAIHMKWKYWRTHGGLTSSATFKTCAASCVSQKAVVQLFDRTMHGKVAYFKYFTIQVPKANELFCWIYTKPAHAATYMWQQTWNSLHGGNGC